MADGDMAKEDTIRYRADAADRKRLEALAAHYGLSPSSTIRMLVKQAYDALPPKPVKGKR